MTLASDDLTSGMKDGTVTVDGCLKAAFRFPGEAGTKWATLAVALHLTGKVLEVSYNARKGSDIVVVSDAVGVVA